jgi:hypothetical protein
MALFGEEDRVVYRKRVASEVVLMRDHGNISRGDLGIGVGIDVPGEPRTDFGTLVTIDASARAA